MKKIYLIITLSLLSFTSLSQVAINYTGSQAATHSILDVKSDTTGMIIPRMSTIQKNVLAAKLSSDHQGMIIFDKTANMLVFWDGSEFKYVESVGINELIDTDGDTYIDVESGTDPDDIIVSTNGTIYWTFKNGRLEISNTGNSIFIGSNAGLNDDLSDNANVFIGHESGKVNTTGSNNTSLGVFSLTSNGASPTYSFNSSDNVALGSYSLNSNTDGYKNTSAGSYSMFLNTAGQRNTAFGYKALYSNSLGHDNIAIGHESLLVNDEGYYNVALGADALHSQTNGYRNIAIGKSTLYNAVNTFYNVAVGSESLYTLSSGNSNVALGYHAGYSNTSGSSNIFIGYESGYNETGSNKLYIENSNSTTPLIYGDFSSDEISLMGNVGIGTLAPAANLHVLGSTEIASILIAPDEASSGKDSEILLSEDIDNTYGMSIKYDGGDNRMYFLGKNGTSISDPIIAVSREGNVGFGTGSPAEKFEVVTTSDIRTASFTGEGIGYLDATIFSNNTSTAGVAAYLQTSGTDGTLIVKQLGTGNFMEAFGPNGGDEEWSISNSGVMKFYNSNHYRTIEITPSESGSADAGQITLYSSDGATATIEIDGGYSGDGRIVTNELQITGGSDLSEFFELSNYQIIEKGMVVSIDEHNPGQLKVCDQAFDKKVAGIVSGANEIQPGLIMSQKGTIADGEHLIALSGRVFCMVDATENPVEIGDMLTTSLTPGHAMKVTNYNEARGAIIGKAMTSLKSGKGLVLVLVSLQ